MTVLRRLALPALIVFLIVPASCSRSGSGGRSASNAFHDLSLKHALEKARSEDKLVVADLGYEGCIWCKRLERDTWSDPGVQDWLNKNTVAVKIDVKRVKDVPQKYKPQGYPAILFLRPDGSEIDRIGGYVPAREFLKRAKDFQRKAS